MAASVACQSPSAPSQATSGFFLSTLLLPRGPAVLVLPTTSASCLLFVCAVAVSVFAATLVCRLNDASVVGARPEPPSTATQSRVTSLADQSDGAASQVNCGAF